MWAPALCLLLVGPPKLPPVPGESQAAPEPSTEAAPAPSTPTRSQTERPAKPEPEPERPAKPEPAEGSFSIPETVEPPQPPPSGPTAPPPEAAPTSSAPPTAAPRIGEPTDATPTFPRLPPPARPPYRGTGLFIAGGVAFTVALTEQIVAHHLVKSRCIDPIGRGEFDTGDDVGEAFTGCAPGVLPAMALRVHSDLSLLAAVGLVTAGGMTRANADAYADVFDAEQRRRTVAGLRIAGISLVGAGVVSWLTTGAAAWGVVGNCNTARCVNGGRLMAFITRDLSALMVASGGGMLGYAEAYRRRHDGYSRDRVLSITPQLSWGGAGLSLSGRI